MSISNYWATYATIVTGSLVIYYIFVGWKFYRFEISSLFEGAKNPRRLRLKSSSGSPKEPARTKLSDSAAGEQPSNLPNRPPLPKHQDLYDYLTLEIEEASQKSYDKQDLIQMLQMILREYPSLVGTPFQNAVNSHIDTECAKYGAVQLDQKDKTELWAMI